MGRKRKGGANGGPNGGGGEGGDACAAAAVADASSFSEADPPRPVLSLSPDGKLVAVAYGSKVLLLDVETGAVSSPFESHDAPVRALAFDASSRRVLSGGDDKAVKVFERTREKNEASTTTVAGEEEEVGAKEQQDRSEWRLVARWSAAKKVSAACFSGGGGKRRRREDGREEDDDSQPHAIAADKFGDVVLGPATERGTAEAAERSARPFLWKGAPELYVSKKLAPAAGGGKATTAADAADADASSPPPLPLFGHFCTIVTALRLSRDSRALASCDRDGKVRVTRLPASREALTVRGGAQETIAFCLGHTAFCTGVEFLREDEGGDGEGCDDDERGDGKPRSSYLLASSSGDGCVRLWRAFDDSRGGQPCEGAASGPLALSDAAAEAAERRREACRRVAELVAAKREAKARVTVAAPSGGGKQGAAGDGGGGESAKQGEVAAAAGCGDDGGGDDGEENDDDDEGEGDFSGVELPTSLSLPPAVVCLSGDGNRTLVAAVEGEQELVVLEVVERSKEEGDVDGDDERRSPPLSLGVSARFAVPGVPRPTSLAVDARRRVVWAAGVDEKEGKLSFGLAPLPGARNEGRGEGKGDGDESGLPAALSDSAARALRDLCDAVMPPPRQVSEDLKRSFVSPRVLKNR